MAYNNRKREESSGNHKKAIIEVAKELISKDGYNKISVDRICKAAGVAKGSFYIHYKSKEDIIPDLIVSGFDEIKNNAKKQKGWGSIKFFVLESVRLIMNAGLKMAQMWFSDSVQASEYGRQKLKYDLDTISELLMLCKLDEIDSKNCSSKIVSLYYGALVLWCISDGVINSFLELEKSLDILKDFGGKNE